MKTHGCQNLLALGVRDGVTTTEVVANGHVHGYQQDMLRECKNERYIPLLAQEKNRNDDMHMRR